MAPNRRPRRLFWQIVIFMTLAAICFWVGFWGFNQVEEKIDEAKAASLGAGNALNFNTYNQCAYNGTFCPTGQGLAFWYDANNTKSYSGSGQTVLDLSGKNVHATLGKDSTVNSFDPTFNSTGVKSFVFDGVDDFLETSLASTFSTSFSMETWFKRANNNDTGSSNVQQRIMNLYRTGQTSVTMSLGLQGQTVQAVAQGTVNTVYNSTFIPNTQWQHVLLTYDATNSTGRIYLNAVLHSTFTHTLSAPSAGNAKIGIFDETNATNKRAFAGEMAIMRMYSRALTQSEITQNFDNEKDLFGFTNPALTLSGPTSASYGTKNVSTTSQTATATLSTISLSDRRATFVPWSAAISTSNLVTGSLNIPARNILLTPGSLSTTTGSGLFNNAATGGNFTASGSAGARSLVVNSSNNGGGTFTLTPTLTVNIPANARAGSYTAVVTISVS